VGLVARVIEAAGIPTVLVSTGRDLTFQVRPPRSVFVNFPMGNPFGRPGDREQQTRILLDALHIVETAREGGTLVDLSYAWGEDFAALSS
jgi:D-proline reductase (dithiol) PrdB